MIAPLQKKGKREEECTLPFALCLHANERFSWLTGVSLRTTPHPYWRPLRYEWSEPSLIGSLMMMSPLRILMLYRQEGLVQTHALYSMEAPWLPKSESGTRSPSLHLRHRGNAFSTKSPPSFSLEVIIACPTQVNQARLSEKVSRGGASAAASASPQQGIIHALTIIPQLPFSVSR
jgi:hypothetical protein